ncbi:S-adenosylmethionine-diacylglycerol 3-amino-3-carboxypropyl transferase [Rhodopirellula rubra]|uniref:S-adenosylmethionine-diacylglycerol 3-amino-3-carboxypropyl transferase n=1 Tax=Aporhodopirellula rubra TaxID=980271 RepID=A0A7W5H9H9_9BACT|nr:BtaA family protein [Aporhodopirellula rubra]MBB3210563.1 S-adenosylmethionine-diacylglycerol 3-amino-3-carboxypropyl transferase [Aporhodopirellula rubra]
MAFQWLANRCFTAVHRQNLVYNTCWEDPEIDRRALELGPDDSVALITSAGCNALDYALESPREVHAIDVNPLQNALLELKIAAINTLDHDDFFQLFGKGCHSRWESLYRDNVRDQLSPQAKQVWDLRSNFFDGSHRRRSFYFRGTSGLFAWLINSYVKRSPDLRAAIDELLDASSVEHQREIYARRNVDRLLWTRPLRWALRRDTTMAMLGVPRSQRNQIDRGYPGGIAGFIQDRIASVFQNTPLKHNYFWRVYLTGEYTEECCPEYLRAGNFDRLKGGLANRISVHTSTIETFLTNHHGPISRFVLLDHMDWLYDRFPEHLASEWQAILDRAATHSRVLWRSAALEVDFIDPLKVWYDGQRCRLGDLLSYHRDLARQLHDCDRVNTYGSFYIADVKGMAA